MNENGSERQISHFMLFPGLHLRIAFDPYAPARERECTIQNSLQLRNMSNGWVDQASGAWQINDAYRLYRKADSRSSNGSVLICLTSIDEVRGVNSKIGRFNRFATSHVHVLKSYIG